MEKHGIYISTLPTALIFVAILLPGILNLSVKGFIISLIIAFTIEQIIVFLAEKKYKRKKFSM